MRCIRYDDTSHCISGVFPTFKSIICAYEDLVYLVCVYLYHNSKYRIATGRHTLAQTLVGAAVGIITGSSAYFLETQNLRIFLPEDLFPSAPLWLRYFIIVTGVIVLFRKQLAKKIFKYKVEA